MNCKDCGAPIVKTGPAPSNVEHEAPLCLSRLKGRIARLTMALEYYAHGEGAHTFYGTVGSDVSKVEEPQGFTYYSGKRAREALSGHGGGKP